LAMADQLDRSPMGMVLLESPQALPELEVMLA